MVYLPLHLPLNSIHGSYWVLHPGQIIIFHQPRFPWNRGISLTFSPPFGVKTRVFGRYNLTRLNIFRSDFLGPKTQQKSQKSKKSQTKIPQNPWKIAAKPVGFLCGSSNEGTVDTGKIGISTSLSPGCYSTLTKGSKHEKSSGTQGCAGWDGIHDSCTRCFRNVPHQLICTISRFFL